MISLASSLKRLAFLVLAAILPVFAILPTLAAAPAADAADASAPDYRQIDALFRKHCLDCHAQQEPEAGLVMETHADLLKGGQSGVAVLPGKSNDSPLILFVEGRVEKDGKKKIMPPGKREKLKPAEIALLRAWIDNGAKPSALPALPPELSYPRIQPVRPPPPSVRALAWSATAGLLAVGRPGYVELVSLDSRAVLRTLTGHQGSVQSVAFTPDGRHLFAASGDAGVRGEVRQWETATGTLVRVLDGHSDAVYAVAVSPDGATLATGSYDQRIRLWSVADGAELRVLRGHNGGVFALDFRPDGALLASASADRTVKLWDVRTGERRDTLTQPLKEQYAVAFSADGTRLYAAGADNRLRVWRISPTAAETTNPLLEARYAHEGSILRIVASPDGKHLLTSADDRTLKLWSTDPLAERRALEQQPDWTPGLAFVPQKSLLVAGRLDGSIAYYDLETGKTAKPAVPLVTAVQPRGVQRGSTTRIELTGSNLVGVTAIDFKKNGIDATLDPEPDPSGRRLGIRLEVGAQVEPGAYEFTLINPGGTSKPARVHVDTLPQQDWPQTDKPEVQAGFSGGLWGAFDPPGRVYDLTVHGRPQQKLVIDVAARSLGSKALVALELSDETGRILDTSDASDRQDPLLEHTFKRAGRVRLRLRELTAAGSPDHFFRVSLGDFPVVLGYFPLAIPAGRESEVQAVGLNLREPISVKLSPAGPGEVQVPLDSGTYRIRTTGKIMADDLPAVRELEPNNSTDHAAPLPVPGAVDGRFDGPNQQPDSDYYRFQASPDQRWLIETLAAERGSLADTRIEVLTDRGEPVERLRLQAVRNTAINFRPIDSTGNGARLDNWEEMQLNDYLYLKGEVVRLFRMPQGPDSDMLFYTSAGRRRTYFDTTAMSHALEEPCYIVVPLDPGAPRVANGLPSFPLYYENDDDAERRKGSDSRLYFRAPTNGTYLVRVSDTRGASGDRFIYRLIVRPPKPDFKVTVEGENPTVNRGSGRSFKVIAERTDGFEGEIRVDLAPIPPGFVVSTPLVIEAGHREAVGTIHAAEDAAWTTNTPPIASRASARIDGLEVTRDVASLGVIKVGEAPKLYVEFGPDRSVQNLSASNSAPTAEQLVIDLAPGATVSTRLAIRRNGHDDLVTFNVDNLPHGVIVDNIGLNGVLIPKGEDQREVFLTAAGWVAETDRLCHAVENQAGRQTSRPVLLRIRRPLPAPSTASR